MAIVGASEKPGALGASVLSNLLRQQFDGDIYLINPKRPEIAGRPCLPSVEDLPQGVDVAVLAIPRVAVLETVRALALRRVGAAVIFSAGFAEAGAAGLEEQAEIARVAAEAGMVVEGPNCLGMVNFVDGVPLTFVELPATRLNGRAGLAIVSQSGAMAAVIGVTLLKREVGLSYSVSTGNEAGSGVEDYVEYLVDDPDTRVIAMIVEQFRKPRRFLAAADRARKAGKPIVLLHPGRSSAARESAATHTGAMAGDYEVMRTKVKRAGVILVETLEELGDVAEILIRCHPMRTRGTVVIGESGAFKALTLDLAEQEGLQLPAICDGDSLELRNALPDFVPVSNPLDVTAQGLSDPDLYRRTLRAALSDERFGAVLVGLIQTDSVTSDIKFPPVLETLGSMRPSKPVVVAGLDEGTTPAAHVSALRNLSIPYFPTPERAVRALARLDAWGPGAHAEPEGDVHRLNGLPHGQGVVAEYQSKALLAQLGVPFPPGRLVRTIEDAHVAASDLGYPVVVKAQSADLPHKSEAGGVLVGLSDPAALDLGWTRLNANVTRHRPDLKLDGVLIEAMGSKGVEMIIGGRNDPDWGPVVLVGFGGVQAELTNDVRLMAPDLSLNEITTEIGELRGAPLLQGFRGAPPCDVDALACLVATVGRLLRGERSIAEIDLNPVIVLQHGQGVVALDALIFTSGRP